MKLWGLTSVPTHQEVAQKEPTDHNCLYSLSSASISWKFFYLTCFNEQAIFSLSSLQMKDERGQLDMFREVWSVG